MIRCINTEQEKEEICRQVLGSLPDWFGIPESTREYVQVSRSLPFWADEEQEKVRGFAVLKETSPFTAEIMVMGVYEEFHRCGVGKKVFGAFYEYAKKSGYEFIQVKTVKQGLYKEYDRTNAFYKSLGFRELECFPSLWDESNPCQIYVMAVI